MEDCYDIKVDHNHTDFPMIRETVKEEQKSLRFSIYLFNKSKLTYYPVNYIFIAKLVGSKRDSKMIKRRLNNLPLNSKMLTRSSQSHYFTRRCYLRTKSYSRPTFCSTSYHTTSYWIAPQMALIVRVYVALAAVLSKDAFVILSIMNNDNNAIAVIKSVNVLIKVINGIEGDANKVIIAPWKSKQPNLDVLKYIKRGN